MEDILLGAELPKFLSCFPEKLRLYAADGAFLSAWRTIWTMRGSGRLAPTQLWEIGSVLFKADSMLRGNAGRGINLLLEKGYRPLVARPIAFREGLVEELWRHSLGRFSPERIELLKRLQSLSPSLYLIVARPAGQTSLPCTLELTELKGQVVLERRLPGTLRHAMGHPQTAFLNFVHTADEPADLVRELGLFFDEDERRAVLEEIVLDRPVDLDSLWRATTTDHPADLDENAALVRLASILRANPGFDPGLASGLPDLSGVSFAHWRGLMERMRSSGITYDAIDDIVVSSGLTPLKRFNPSQPFPSCEARHWENHLAARQSEL